MVYLTNRSVGSYSGFVAKERLLLERLLTPQLPVDRQLISFYYYVLLVRPIRGNNVPK